MSTKQALEELVELLYRKTSLAAAYPRATRRQLAKWEPQLRRLRRLVARRDVVATCVGARWRKNKLIKRWCFRIYVKAKLPESDVPKRRLLPRLLHLPWAGMSVPVDVDSIGEVRLTASPVVPLTGGVAVRHVTGAVGSIGCFVRDNGTGGTCLLSNSHVIGNSGLARVGDPVLLGPGPAPQVASILRVAPFAFASNARNVDAAVAQLLPGVSSSNSVPGIGAIAGTKALDAVQADTNTLTPNGEQARFAGVGSGLVKTGRITHKNLTIEQFFPDPAAPTQARKALFFNQIVCQAHSVLGDSGSVLLDSGRRVIGLVWANTDQGAIANPIKDVLDSLNVSI
jgi:hypothetical protein